MYHSTHPFIKRSLIKSMEVSLRVGLLSRRPSKLTYHEPSFSPTDRDTFQSHAMESDIDQLEHTTEENKHPELYMSVEFLPCSTWGKHGTPGQQSMRQ